MTTHVSVNVTLPSDRQVMMTRLFDAPRSVVFDCYTKPELLKRWMFPEGWQLVVCENDARIGSDFRWEWRKKNGQDMSVSGVYREIVRPERIVRTELFDPDWTGGETIGTLLLAEHDGTTVMTMSVLYASREARDTALEFGMKDGAAKSYAQLDALLASELNRSQTAA
jgi:uncharacterized protein YndB with AHSA1/START domain